MSDSGFPVPIFPRHRSSLTDENKEELLENFAVDWTTFINQIFGDENIRKIIMKTYKKKGAKLLTQEFEDPTHGWMNHHVTNLECSVDMGYQNTRMHRGDMLCQSYSLMNYLDIGFDKRNASELWSKKDKRDAYNSRKSIQDAMIQTYRTILSDNAKKGFLENLKLCFTQYSKFLKITDEPFVYPNETKDPKGYWVDFSKGEEDEGELFTYQQFKPDAMTKQTKLTVEIVEQMNENFYNFILSNIRRVLDAWENYGWLCFIGEGTYADYLRNSTPKNTQKRMRTHSVSPNMRETRSRSSRQSPRRSTRRAQNDGR
jgi:hypothetical protein